MSTEGRWERMLGWFLTHRLIVAILTLVLLGAGIAVHPFDDLAEQTKTVLPPVLADIPRDRVAVDAIPDIGENQQIVFTSWPGRSPTDIEDQITYPLTTQLLGLPGVKTVRSSSMFGFSSIYVIFEDGVEFYWSRSRILEKLSALPPGLLPEGASPMLGPDATALGQVYWYTLEGRDPDTGEVVGGWDLHELRTLQDWTVRHALQSTPGVSEVASIGGHTAEYQIDVDPKKLEAYGIPLTKLAGAVREANRDIGARTLEINRAEYVVRGVGQLEDLEDIEETVVTEQEGRPLRVKDLATVGLGPAQRRGALDVGGAEAVGGVVVARYGENPVEVIESLEQKIDKLAPSLPVRTLENGQKSQVTIVPFYDRSQVVEETLGTLSDALIQQILITIVVVLVLLGNLRSSLVISSVLPLSVLATFGLMKLTGVTANVMSLAGIAIAIGTMVDMGIVLTENMLERFDEADPGEHLTALKQGAAEVAPAVATSVLTTVFSFLPVFGLTASEGKLFHPLAYTKTFALLTALGLSLLFLPTFASWILRPRVKQANAATPGGRLLAALKKTTHRRDIVLVGIGAALLVWGSWWMGALVMIVGATRISQSVLPARFVRFVPWLENGLVVAGVLVLLTDAWMPFGVGAPWSENFGLVAGVSLGLLVLFWAFIQVYAPLLKWMLEHKLVFLTLPTALILAGSMTWLGFDSVLGWLPQNVRQSAPVAKIADAFPGIGQEFMPPFDEGQFLYMPTVMPHASLGQSIDQLKLMDAAIMQIPEVEVAVGKLGRADSALDPAPVSMFETVVTYKPEYRTEPDGTRVRQWRDHIRSTDDIWKEVQAAAEQPGLTSAPKLMPIQTRIVMLQSGMRAPMGVKLQGPNLESLEKAGKQLEEVLREIPSVRSETVFAERVVGKPYLEIRMQREELARHGLSVEDVQRTLQIALSGMPLTTLLDGRERYDVRVRYQRDSRQDIEALGRLLVPTKSGRSIPLEQLTELAYVKGPQAIKSEDTFLTSYVIFDHYSNKAELEVVEEVRQIIEAKRKAGELELPAGIKYDFAGNYKNQVRSADRLAVLVPLALLLIFLVLHLQFSKISTTAIIYTGVAVAVSGGFVLMWFYQQPWFMDFSVAGHAMREVFQIRPTNLSVAVWVGTIALVGIATDDGVVMATYLDQRFARDKPETIEEIRDAVLEAGKRRVRPCLMTTATTLLALLPVITSTGRGSDVMIPMAIPSIGGMAVELITLFVVPVLYCSREELRHRFIVPHYSEE